MESLEEITMPSPAKNTRHKKKKYCKYIYTLGDKYMGGATLRHTKCVEDMGRRIPAYMGWLWTNEAYDIDKPWHGWRPGAIGKSVMKLMSTKAIKAQEIDEAAERVKKLYCFRKTKRSSIVNSEFSGSEKSAESKVALAVNKRGNVITVTVNPLRDVTAESETGDSPFMDCDPLVYRLVEKKSFAEEAAREIKMKRREKNRLENEIRRALEKVITRICTHAYADVYCNDLQAIDSIIEKNPTFDETGCTCEEEDDSETSSDESDWEIEYTPPAALAAPEKRRKADLVHAETQFVPEKELSEITLKSKMRLLNQNNLRLPLKKGTRQ